MKLLWLLRLLWQLLLVVLTASAVAGGAAGALLARGCAGSAPVRVAGR